MKCLVCGTNKGIVNYSSNRLPFCEKHSKGLRKSSEYGDSGANHRVKQVPRGWRVVR